MAVVACVLLDHVGHDPSQAGRPAVGPGSPGELLEAPVAERPRRPESGTGPPRPPRARTAGRGNLRGRAPLPVTVGPPVHAVPRRARIAGMQNRLNDKSSAQTRCFSSPPGSSTTPYGRVQGSRSSLLRPAWRTSTPGSSADTRGSRRAWRSHRRPGGFRTALLIDAGHVLVSLRRQDDAAPGARRRGQIVAEAVTST